MQRVKYQWLTKALAEHAMTFMAWLANKITHLPRLQCYSLFLWVAATRVIPNWKWKFGSWPSLSIHWSKNAVKSITCL